MNNRLTELRTLLAKREIDAAIITDEKNIGYLCGYFYEDGYLLIDTEHAYLVTDFRYAEEAAATALSSFEVVTPKDRLSFLADIFACDSVKTLGYESSKMTVSTYHMLKNSLSPSLVPMGDILSQMRAVKSAEEITCIRQAQGIAEKAFSHLLDMMHPNMTEREIATELAYFMQKNGAAGTSFETIAVSGAASALPHGKCRNLPISKGFLTMDFGCVYQGYCSDMTRTVAIGKASEDMKHLYQTVLSAQAAAIQSIRAGAVCADVDAAARTIIEQNGYKGAFGHGLGHGVGLDIHELPNLSPSAKEQRLRSGNIVTVEPGIYLTGKYGCRIEDMGCVTEGGFDNFTSASKELIELFA